MDFNQIQELIRLVSKNKIAEFILKEGDTKLVIRNQTSASGESAAAPAPVVVSMPQPTVLAAPVAPVAAAPAPKAEAAPAPAPAPAAAGGDGMLTIKSPMVGTFYRSAGPDKDAFVKVGDTIEKGQKVCIIEAMKLFNEVDSEVAGKIVKVLVEDASPVEYEQPLFLVDPS